MSKTFAIATSLAEEFKKAQFLEQVPEANQKTFARAMFTLAEEDESAANKILKDLACINDAVDLDDEDLENLADHPALSDAEKQRLAFWMTFLIVNNLPENWPENIRSGQEVSEESASRATEWIAEMRADVEKNDPEFAAYLFGPGTGPS